MLTIKEMRNHTKFTHTLWMRYNKTDPQKKSFRMNSLIMSNPHAMKTSSRTALFLPLSSTNLKAVTEVPSSNRGCVTDNTEDILWFSCTSRQICLKICHDVLPHIFSNSLFIHHSTIQNYFISVTYSVDKETINFSSDPDEGRNAQQFCYKRKDRKHTILTFLSVHCYYCCCCCCCSYYYYQ